MRMSQIIWLPEAENKPQVSSISHSRTLDEMAEFWDTHSLADYDEQTHEVENDF